MHILRQIIFWIGRIPHYQTKLPRAFSIMNPSLPQSFKDIPDCRNSHCLQGTSSEFLLLMWEANILRAFSHQVQCRTVSQLITVPELRTHNIAVYSYYHPQVAEISWGVLDSCHTIHFSLQGTQFPGMMRRIGSNCVMCVMWALMIYTANSMWTWHFENLKS